MLDHLSTIFLFGILAAFASGLPVIALHVYNSRRRKLDEAANQQWAEYVEHQSMDAIFTVDEAGVIHSFNAAAERIFGYPAKEVVGRNISILLSPPAGSPPEYGLNHLHTARPTADGIGLEVEGRRKDGTTAPLDLLLSETNSGARRLFRGIARDLTDRLRLDSATADARFSTEIIETAGAAIMVVDQEGHIARVNRCWEKATHYTFAEAQGRYFWEALLDEREWSYAKATLARVLAERGIEKGTAEWRTGGGNRLRVWYAMTALQVGRGASEAAVVVGMNAITGHREGNGAAGMEALERLAAGIATRFNNLLTSINGYSDLVLHTLDEKDPLRHDIEEIKNAGERAAGLTSQLLAFSQRQPMQAKPIQLNALIAGMKDTLRTLLGDRTQLVTVLDLDLGWMRGDPSWVEQVILNLAVNARDAMPDGGKVTIETANALLDHDQARALGDVIREGEYVMLAVSDTGCGIPESDRVRVFEPFFTTKAPGKGTGLGLSTVYGVVRQAGGSVIAHGAPGQGTTIRIYLPQVAETDQTAKNGKGLFLVRGAGK
jgi:two-component system, cell cycle sensor histidine kinase and response regulator CckA